MEIINKTNWRTSDLKKIITRAFAEDDKVEGKYLYRKYLVIKIFNATPWQKHFLEHFKKKGIPVPRERRAYTGRAFLGGYRMIMKLPSNEIDKRMLVKIFVHELTHIRGYRHSKMGYWLTDKEAGSWMDDDINYPVRQKEIKLKPKVDLQVKRYEHALAAVKDKKSKLKRLQNQIKKWTQKTRYYEHVLAANGKIKKED